MSEMDGNIDSGFIQISHNIFRSKTPWREGTTVYNGYQLLESEERRLLTIKMIVPYNNEHVRQLKRLADLPPIPSIIQILRIIEVHDDHIDKLYVVMERFGPNNLQSYLDYYPDFRHKVYDRSVHLTMQLVSALCELYQEGFILENLTPRRVFFSPDDLLIKLSLFAVVENPHENDFVLMGSYRNAYQAPEVLQSSETSLKSSIFSLGVILAIIWSERGQHPFGEGAISQMYNIMTNKDSNVFWVATSEDDYISMLVDSMMESYPEKRPTLEEILKHQFFRSLVNTETGQAIIAYPEEEIRPEPPAMAPEEIGSILPWFGNAVWTTEATVTRDITGTVNEYLTKLRNAQKDEMVAIFYEILEYTPDVYLEIARSITRIDLSGTKLSLDDVDKIGRVVRVFKHMTEINFSFCNLQYGSLLYLRDAATDNVKIDKLNVTGNPELLASGLCSGIDFCAAIGCTFVFDIEHLSKNDRLKLKNHTRTRQDKDEIIDETEMSGGTMSKNRKLMTKEEQFQKLYKTTSRNIARLQRFSLDFDKKSETANGEQKDENARKRMLKDPRPALPVGFPVQIGGIGTSLSTESVKKVPINAEESSSTDSERDVESEPQTDAELSKVSNVRSQREKKAEATSFIVKKKKKTGPRTLTEYVKLKPVDNFLQAMKSLDEHQESQTETRPMHQQKLKIMAMVSDRRRFESVALKSGTNLRPYIRCTRLEASTAFLKSSRGDSGFRTRSSFSEAVSCKSSLRRYSKAEKDTEERNSIDSTQPASLERIEEEEYNPNRLIEQKLEMTVLGLGVMENKKDRIQSWMEDAEFKELPSDQATNKPDYDFIEEFATWLSAMIIDDFVGDERVSMCRSDVNLEQSCQTKSYKTEEIGPAGGSIELYGCEIRVPAGAVKRKTKIRISVDNNPDNFPISATAISSILGCKLWCDPPIFLVPVHVRLVTWFSAKHRKRITAIIMRRKSSDQVWEEIKTVPLGERNIIEYKVTHFCGHVAAVTNENIDDGNFI